MEPSDSQHESATGGSAGASDGIDQPSTWAALPQRASKRRRQRAAENVCVSNGMAGSHCREPRYEYLDHTADIQLHSWGETKPEAFEQCALAMFGYMTDLECVCHDPTTDFEVDCEGHDLLSLLYNFLDELLYRFCTEDRICRDVRIVEFDHGEDACRLRAQCFGERFDLKKHSQGTEVKAITYSNMQVLERPGGGYEVFVIVDI